MGDAMKVTVRRRSPSRYFEVVAVVAGFIAPWFVTFDWAALALWVLAYVGLRALLLRAWDPLTESTAMVVPAERGVELRYASGRTEALGPVESVAERTKPTRELRIERRGKPLLRLVVPPDIEPTSMLASLGLGVIEVRRSFTLGSLGARLFWLVALGLVLPRFLRGNESAAAEWMRWLVRVSYLPAFLLATVPTRCELARDGVTWRWMWVQRFVSFSDVEGLDFYPSGAAPEKRIAVRITTRRGSTHRLLASRVSGRFFIDLAEELDAYRARTAEVPGGRWVREPSEQVRAWIDRLGALGRAASAYRGLAEDPWPVAADPTASPIARCGALLFACARPEARGRAETLARSVASPALRDALLAIAEGAASDVVEARVRALDDGPEAAR